MRSGKILGLVPMLAVVVVSVASTGYAAADTTLCKEPWEPFACPAGEQYGAGTELKSILRIGEAEFVAGMIVVKCEQSGMILKTKAVKGAPLPGEITEFFFGGCKGCTNVSAIHLNYSTELERTTLGNGSLTLKNGGAGNPAIKIAGCPGGVSCIYKAEALATFLLGGAPPEYSFSKAPMTKESGGCAAATGSFSATYHFPWARETPEMEWITNPIVWVEKT
jgi:hypothetical protein